MQLTRSNVIIPTFLLSKGWRHIHNGKLQEEASVAIQEDSETFKKRIDLLIKLQMTFMLGQCWAESGLGLCAW